MTLRLGIAILALSLLSCTPARKAVQAVERGEDAIKAIIAHEGIRAITVSDWAVILTGKADEIGEFTLCEEARHQEQASWYDSPNEFRLAYLTMLAAKALEAGADDGRYIGLVVKLLDGPTMDEINALGEEFKAMLRDAYKVHPMEIDAKGACQHLLED